MAEIFRPAVVAAALLGVAAILAHAKTSDPDDQLEKIVDQFKATKQKADSEALRAFDRAITIAKTSSKIKETVRRDFIDKAFKAKQQFEKDGIWANEPLLGLQDDEFEYITKLAEAFEPVDSEYERTLKIYRQQKDEIAVNEILDHRESLMALAFPGRKGFNPKSFWTGNIVGRKGNRSTMTFRVVSVKQSVVKAVVATNPQQPGHPVFEVTGTLVGNYLDVLKTKQVQGKGSPARLRGYLSINRLFLLGTWGRVALERRSGPVAK